MRKQQHENAASERETGMRARYLHEGCKSCARGAKAARNRSKRGTKGVRMVQVRCKSGTRETGGGDRGKVYSVKCTMRLSVYSTAFSRLWRSIMACLAELQP